MLVDENNNMAAFPVPVRAGYSFKGWKTLEGQELTSDNLRDGQTLYAQWNAVYTTWSKAGHYGMGNDFTAVYKNNTSETATVYFYIYNCYDADETSHGGNYINISKNGNPHTGGGTLLGWQALGYKGETWTWASTIYLQPGETLNILTQDTVCDYQLTVTEVMQ